MDALIALTVLAGLAASVSALWVDSAVSARQTGRVCKFSLAIASAVGGIAASLAWLWTQNPIMTSAALASTTAGAVAVSTDIRFGLLADLTSFIIAVSALAAAPLLSPGLSYAAMLISSSLALGILAIAGLYVRLRRGQIGLGAGDLLLAGALGLWCPPDTAALGIAIGAVMTLAVGLITKARDSARLPFGPGLIAGFTVAFAIDRLL